MKVRLWQDNEGQNDEESGVRCLPSFCPTSFCPSEIDLTNDAFAVCSDFLTRSRYQFKVLHRGGENRQTMELVPSLSDPGEV